MDELRVKNADLHDQLAAKDAEIANLTKGMKASMELSLMRRDEIDKLKAEIKRLRDAVRRLIELDVDATAYEDGTPLTKDAIMLRDVWREAAEAAKEKP